MNERKLIYKALKKIESVFPNLFTYGYKDEGSEHSYWWICIDDYYTYRSGEFKSLTENLRKTLKGLTCVFSYVKPIEKALLQLADSDNLVLNIKND